MRSRLKTSSLAFLLSGWWLVALGQLAGESLFPLSQAKRVLFLGNSITYAGEYVSLFESHCIVGHPSRRQTVINLALPSETVSGLSEANHANGEFPRPWLFTRLTRVLEKAKPDVVFVCYGMNDGIYLPFDEKRFEAYKDGMQRLHSALKAAGAKRILIMTPPVHDDREIGLNGYNLVLDVYAEWLLKQQEKQGWEVIDVHFFMRDYLLERRSGDAQFKLAKDGVHPGLEGHWVIFRQLCRHFGENFADSLTREGYMEANQSFSSVYDLVSKRQQIMKNAWLSYIGHDRPGMTKGLSMKEAKKEYRKFERMIENRLKFLGL